MTPDLTEEEMRRALFGAPTRPVPAAILVDPEPAPTFGLTQQLTPASKKIASKAFTPRLRVTLRVGNEFEGEMHGVSHEADTLSKLLAEQEAVKAARKKFRYVEVVSVESM